MIEAVAKYPQFKFYEFNPRRHRRGVEGCRVLVTYSSNPADQQLLWMSPKDIRDNIAEFGDDPELQKALAAYRQPHVEQPARTPDA